MHALDKLFSAPPPSRPPLRTHWRIAWDTGAYAPIHRRSGGFEYVPNSPCDLAHRKIGQLLPSLAQDKVIQAVAESVAPHGRVEQVHEDGRILRTERGSFGCPHCGRARTY